MRAPTVGRWLSIRCARFSNGGTQCNCNLQTMKEIAHYLNYPCEGVSEIDRECIDHGDEIRSEHGGDKLYGSRVAGDRGSSEKGNSRQYSRPVGS